MVAADTQNSPDSPESLDEFLERTIKEFEDLSIEYPELRFTLGQLKSMENRISPISDAPTIDAKSGDDSASISTADKSTISLTPGGDSPAGTRPTGEGKAGFPFGDRITVPEGEKHYEIHDEVGRGGMGAVVKVLDKDLNRFLAMKLMLEGSSNDPERRSRFVQEAEVMGQLDHPGIVALHDFGLDQDGKMFFTMPLVKGKEFEEVIALGRDGKADWNISRLLGALISASQAVAFAHARGIVHRDLKPSNIMVGRFGEVYVMDWGLAKVKGREDLHDLRLKKEASSFETVETRRRSERESSPDSPLITMDGLVVGTPSYMSPEQASGDIECLDQRADVYSLGAILYVILTGQLPYVPGEAKITPRTVLARLLDGPPTPVHKLNPRAPADLIAICEKSMARKADDRYSNSLELAEDLQSFLDGRVVKAYRTGAIVELGKWCKRNPLLTSAISLIVFLSLIFSIVISQQYDELEESNEALKESGATNKILVGFLDPLRDRFTYEKLIREEKSLWPASLEMVGALDAWLKNARELYAKKDAYQAVLINSEIKKYDIEKISSFSVSSKEMAEAIKAQMVSVSKTLAPSLEKFEANIKRVEKRLGHARNVRERSVTGEEAGKAWDQAIKSIARTGGKYNGLRVTRQLGLLPIGENRRTGLWEFQDLLTGSLQEKRSSLTGELVLEEGAGLIFVLLPGARFQMGRPEERKAGHPVIELDPFFISKYEMSQDVWQRMTGSNPSLRKNRFYPVESINWEIANRVIRNLGFRLPSEAQWEYACRAGSETEWSSGDDPVSLVKKGPKDDPDRLPPTILANIDEKAFLKSVGDKIINLGSKVPGGPGDGYEFTAPIGPLPGNSKYLKGLSKPSSGIIGHYYPYKSNEFGLFHMHGNVWEFCADAFVKNPHEGRQTDDKSGLRILSANEFDTIKRGGSLLRPRRGGAFNSSPEQASSFHREETREGFSRPDVGVRPVRLLFTK